MIINSINNLPKHFSHDVLLYINNLEFHMVSQLYLLVFSSSRSKNWQDLSLVEFRFVYRMIGGVFLGHGFMLDLTFDGWFEWMLWSRRVDYRIIDISSSFRSIQGDISATRHSNRFQDFLQFWIDTTSAIGTNHFVSTF